jgi:hypothetical protein
MPLDDALTTLLHLLVFAYWLGGDIGVFYSSFLLVDPKRAAAGRLAAGKILSDVDLAPRICLLLTAPTGLALAAAKGWIVLDAVSITLLFAAAAAWIFVILHLHRKHGPAWLRTADVFARIAFLCALTGAGAMGLAGVVELPSFLSLKLLLLAFCIAMGLLVRASLTGFTPAYVALASKGPNPESDKAIADALAKARPFVVAIWAALIVAAYLGVATPQ